MHSNEILYKIQHALNLSKEAMLKAYALAGHQMDSERLESLLKRRLDDGFEVCTYEELGLFLDGLVIFKRGPSPAKKKSDEIIELTNNLILKKLRIALELKEAESEIIFGLGDVTLSKQEFKALFRKEGHKNFKKCSDALLISFLDGLDEFYYIGEID
jgi:uncharacterized protein YehS (DUF1456 family)